MNSGIELDDDYLESKDEFKPLDITKPTVESILSCIKSGIGLDIAKNHTGICIWEDNEVKTYGFKLEEYDKSDYFAEYRMRANFKKKLKEIVQGKHFEFCIVEDVYGGDNFDTTRKLLALNTVMDELIFDGVCTVNNFVRWSATKWMSYFRMIYRQKGKLKSKVETQGILEYLNFDFYMKNKDLSEKEKKDIFFEDICDATAMLCGMIMKQNTDLNLAKSISVKLSDVKMLYIESLEDIYSIRDKRVQEEGYVYIDINTRALEKNIINAVKSNPDVVLCTYLPVSKLGRFGIQHKFEFFESGEGYLIFYKKG